MRWKTKANEITLKLQAIKDKIAEHEDSLFPENTGKLRTGLSCHHNFNSDKSHEIKSGVEKDVDLFIEDLNRVSAKYWATGYKIGSKSKPTESRKKNEQKKKGNKGRKAIKFAKRIIRLIEKKDKDKRFAENWRPISLLKVDYKIGSKALATRLEKVLPEIIHENQCAYVKGRTIFDAVRSIGDIIEYTKLNNIPGLMTTFDFKKAFDSINWQFLTEA